MKKSALLVVLFIFFGCKNQVSKEDLKNLTGYWEIERVTFPNGETKEFTMNPTIDYLELDGYTGFRKKMQPNFDGGYTTSNDAEPFSIEEKNGQFEFQYKNAMSAWTEKIRSISKDEFSVTNQDSLTYHYKRFQPIKARE
jgi:hypothetical protein